MIRKTPSKILALSFVLSSLLLSACASTTAKAPTGKTSAKNSARPSLESEAIDKAMQTALAQAEASGDSAQILATLEQVYNHNPNDAIIATRFARALREDDQINNAKLVLKKFVNQDNPNVEAVTEMAMTQLAAGDYNEAKNYALKSTAIDPKNARGYLALGTAQDALKDHANAEQSFRQGLKYWEGDPSPILNNLALNLASQGHLNEALSLLERAVKISPKRMELERNRRIIATLVETSSSMAPPPQKKPEIKIPEAAKPIEPAPAQQSLAPQSTNEVKAESKQMVEKNIEAKAPQQTMKVKATGVTSAKVTTNVKLKSNVNE